MSPSRRTFLLDSTVLLYDIDVIQHFRRSRVIIPSYVIDELDKYVGQKTDIGVIARKQLQFLSECAKLGDLSVGVMIDGDILLMVEFSIGHVDKRKLPQIPDHHQYKILHVAVELNERSAGVALISRSQAVRLMGNLLGIETEDFEPPKKKIDVVQKMRTLYVEKTVIDHSYIDGHVKMPHETFLPNEYVYLTAKENSSLLCRFHPIDKKLYPIKRKHYKVARSVLPRNLEQQVALDMLLAEDIPLVSVVGKAGTGKTLLAMAAAFEMVFDKGLYRNMIITRPMLTVGNEIGYLPGGVIDKLRPHLGAYFDNFEVIREARGEEISDIAEWALSQPKIKIEAIAHMRGRSFYNSIVIVDEAQNCTKHELKTLISRAGARSKVVLIGDIDQIDAKMLNQYTNGLTEITAFFYNSKIAAHASLINVERSPLAEAATLL